MQGRCTRLPTSWCHHLICRHPPHKATGGVRHTADLRQVALFSLRGGEGGGGAHPTTTTSAAAARGTHAIKLNTHFNADNVDSNAQAHGKLSKAVIIVL